MTRVNGESGAGEGGSDFGRKGCNELAATAGLRERRAVLSLRGEASILTAAEREDEERRAGRRGERCDDTKQMCWILYSLLLHRPLNLLVCFAHFPSISITFRLRLVSHMK